MQAGLSQMLVILITNVDLGNYISLRSRDLYLTLMALSAWAYIGFMHVYVRK